ncbi:MAG: cysteine--tRNA ligase [Proteobacteria bacterium]|uniref:Cysteine--tRNA ligase n=3 Tax=Candidatus Fonsibacter lacus TaxID=2576439 RepID=A0A964V088_9PROT|nr:cysteine--tRNA ligase [Candidatus Fonsibacter lacus]
MNSLKIYNTLSKAKEEFIPLNKNLIGMYVCGPTVYDDPHIGNARPLIIFDLVYRILIKKFGKNKVNYVRNITDIDDKIIQRANELKINIGELTKSITDIFLADCKYLNCLNPNHQPKATDHITAMIQMIENLLTKKFAYIKDGNVYFNVNKFKDYGKLSNKNPQELISGSRVEISELKNNPLDFVLWKPSKDKEPSWQSPWGNGRPGWHIECSAMSEKFLGKEFDLHCGGLDLIFPHHENEIAQSICANDSSIFAKYWMHNGYVTVDGKKMSKSDGNFITINNLKNNFNGQVVRLSILGTHYRQPLDWNLNILETNKKILDNWYNLYSPSEDEISDEIFNILLDDLNTPKFITSIHSLYNKAKTGDDLAKKNLNSALKFIGLFNENKEQFNIIRKKTKLSISDIENLIDQRNLARKNKDFKKADAIRLDLEKNEILIEDLNDKTHWKHK